MTQEKSVHKLGQTKNKLAVAAARASRRRSAAPNGKCLRGSGDEEAQGGRANEFIGLAHSLSPIIFRKRFQLSH